MALWENIGGFSGRGFLLEYIAIVAVVVIGISGYFDVFLTSMGVNMPDFAASIADEGRGGCVNIPISACLLATWTLSRGTRSAGRFELLAVAIKIVWFTLILGLGIFYFDTGYHDPFVPSRFGLVEAGIATVFFAVFGYDAVSIATEDSTDGK